MTQPFFPIERLRMFSADGQVYRAFNHLIAARMGTLLLVPQLLVVGRLIDVVDGCPVPWEEVHAVLEYPVTSPVAHADATLAEFNHQQRFDAFCLGLSPAECVLDHIAPLVNGTEKVLRLTHPCGVRYAVVMP